MALQNIEPNTKLPINNLETDSALEADLIKLMPFLRAFAVSLSGKWHLADDLAQETLTKAWQSRRAFTPGSNLKAWLFTILRNEYYSQQRRAWRQADWDQKSAEARPDVSNQQHWAAELSDIASAMEVLPDEQRKALLLVGAAGLSYEEAATHTTMALGTAKSRVSRARRGLKTILEAPTRWPIKRGRAKGNAMNEILSQLASMNVLAGHMRSNVR